MRIANTESDIHSEAGPRDVPQTRDILWTSLACAASRNCPSASFIVAGIGTWVRPPPPPHPTASTVHNAISRRIAGHLW